MRELRPMIIREFNPTSLAEFGASAEVPMGMLRGG